MPRLRFLTVTSAFLVMALAAPALSAAASSHLVVNTLTPKLEEPESGDGSKLKLEFTNITDGPAILTVDAEGQRGCKPTLSKNQLPPNQLGVVEVAVPKSTCNSDDDVLSLKVTADLAAGASQVFQIDPEGDAPSKPEWNALFAFPLILLLSFALAAAFLFRGWKPQNTLRGAGRDKGGISGRWHRLWDRLRQPLTAIDVSTWKFNDNWATNVTGAGALLTGIFGATAAKAFLGPTAESLTALATVGAAIALVFVNAAPIAVLATKSYATREGERSDFFTVGGILLGAVAVITAAIGQLAIIAYTATELDIGIVATVAIWIGFALAVALLLVYSRRSLKDLLERGIEPPAEDPEVAIEAATLIAEAIKAGSAGDLDRGRALQALEQRIQTHQSPARATVRRRRPRSALI